METDANFSDRPLDNEPLMPSLLPSDMRAFLVYAQFACLTHPTDQGTVLVIKAPLQEIRSVQGTVPISLRHELYEHPAAPVIRMVTTIYDQPEHPLALETFINVQDSQQRADYVGLSRQTHLALLFYDEHLEHRLTKMVGSLDREQVSAVLNRAVRSFESIPEDQFSFERAKAAVMASTTL